MQLVLHKLFFYIVCCLNPSDNSDDGPDAKNPVQKAADRAAWHDLQHAVPEHDLGCTFCTPFIKDPFHQDPDRLFFSDPSPKKAVTLPKKLEATPGKNRADSEEMEESRMGGGEELFCGGLELDSGTLFGRLLLHAALFCGCTCTNLCVLFAALRCCRVTLCNGQFCLLAGKWPSQPNARTETPGVPTDSFSDLNSLSFFCLELSSTLTLSFGATGLSKKKCAPILGQPRTGAR